MSQDLLRRSATAAEQPEGAAVRDWPGGWLWLMVLALFLSASLVRAPFPAVNEPHYLGKAKHWWDPGWCPGDFFLDSSNPHLYFYVAVGWLTKFLSLPQAAAVARVLSLGLLAGGWAALSRQLFRTSLAGAGAAALFTLQMAAGNFSGEWLIGGVESKVFAYAAVLWGGAEWFRDRPLGCAVLLAVGVAFHPVAGLWVLIALGLAWLGRWLTGGGRNVRPTMHHIVTLVVLALGTGLGLLPALPLLLGGDPRVAREADRLLLTQRVGHHTDPALFPSSAYWYYGGFLAAWLCLLLVKRPRGALGVIQGVVAASLGITVVGLVVGWSPRFSTIGWQDPWRLWLLKFYPFRLADLMLPMGLALQGAALVEGWLGTAATGLRRAVWGAIIAAAWAGTLGLPAPDANPSGMSAEHYQDWIEMSRWIEEHTPQEALIATANEDWAIKWYAHRPEYVNFKDCPQDAEGIIEWWRRRQTLVDWSRDAKSDGAISEEDLAELRRRTGIDYLLVSRYGPITSQPRHEEGPFRLYLLR